MNKKIMIPLILSSLGVSVLTGCTLVSSSLDNPSTSPSPLQQEVVSSAILARQNKTATALAMKRSAVPAEGDLSFDPTDINATLTSFDAFALDQYSIKTNELVSDNAAYAHKDEIVYTLPDGTTKSVVLYYGVAETPIPSSSTSEDEPTSGDPTSSSEGTSEDATSGETSTENGVTSGGTITVSGPMDPEPAPAGEPRHSDGDEEEIGQEDLHLYGYRHGGFEGMLSAGWSFQNEGDYAEGTMTGTWKQGLAYIEGKGYRFHAEELTFTKGSATLTSTSFGLFARGDFLAVEQAEIVNGDKTANVYAYTAFQNASYTRYLLAENAQTRRLVYKTPFSKLVINRYQKDDKTLYSVHAKVIGAMALVGVYEKVVTTLEDGSTSVTYVLYQGEADAPTEA